MDAIRILFGVILASAFVAIGPVQALADGDVCNGGSSWFDGCTSNNGSSVSVEYNQTYEAPPSSGGYDTSYDSGYSDSSNSSSNSGGGGTGTCTIIAGQNADRCQAFIQRPGAPSAGGAGGPSGPVLPASFSVSDILEIAPSTPNLSMEPNGWGVLGQPVNFWVDAETHRQDGTLLDLPVQVQFTPQSVRWDFGDGNGWSTESLGSSWAEQGLPELSDTATSHRYTERGTVTVTATVSYSAVVFIAGTSIPVTGAVTSTSAGISFELFEQSTVLTLDP
ncbi:PKD domain-containing protein [Gulosibacter molinativorax]|uniref:PKD domain-containing protein n=1 Tax=Gulosibacter molinativorax TaxID=256821 RepID=A0ABT7CBZ2_9MICO|nr:PKD domain-containing protein [Gulosibacter molinativorax]MDJ1372314.1 hypothetical protein [Gulosibacter molinativorax]QUY63408.1 Hypotetical protein [Gulosibacter molinativorax]